MKSNIIGGGLFGCSLAHFLKGHDVTIHEMTSRLGGLCQSDTLYDITYFPNGTHFFHTNERWLWKLVAGILDMREYKHRVKAFVNGEHIYYPVNEKTMQERGWTCEYVYENFMHNYTLKMWEKSLDELGDDVQDRIRINPGDCIDVFFDTFQGHPKGGYEPLFDFFTREAKIIYDTKVSFDSMPCPCDGNTTIVSSPADEFFNYTLGRLEWRGLVTQIEYLDEDSVLPGVSVVTYPEPNVPYLRKHEFKKQTGQKCKGSIIGIDYPTDKVHYYPVDTPRNRRLHQDYQKLAQERKITLAGRLGSYRYYDMDDTIIQAKKLAEELKCNNK